MEKNITNNLKIIESVLESLVDQWYFLYTDKIIVKDGQITVDDISSYGNKYINYFIDIKEFFGGIKIWENQFIKDQDLNEFCKQFLAIHDKLVFVAFSKRSEEIFSNLNQAEKLFKDARPKMLPDKFSNQQNFDRNQNISIAMEVDGHNYHERTESQAVNDRRRDRFLTEKGWRVLRFHRQEIESDLSACMQQVKQVYYSIR